MRDSNPCSYVGRGYNDEDLGKQQPLKSGKAAVEAGGGCPHSPVKVPAEQIPDFPCADCHSTYSVHAVFQPSINLLFFLCASTL